MSQSSLFHPTARQAYKNYFYLKIILFFSFVFWLYGSLKVQPALQADKWATISVAAALSFGIVFLTYAAAKAWHEPDTMSGPSGLGWFYTALAFIACACDVFFVYERMEALSVNGLISTSVTTSPLFNYAVSGCLLVVNLAVSVAMASAYFRAGLHEESVQLDLLDAQHAYHQREEWLGFVKEKIRNLFSNQKKHLKDKTAQVDHVINIKENRRKVEAAHSEAQVKMEEEKAESKRLDAEELRIQNEKRRQVHARSLESMHVPPGPVIDGEYRDMSRDENVITFSNVKKED